MSNEIDYSSIDIPENEDPENYSWQARRAEILQLLERAGHPRMLNQADLARRYDTSRQNVHNDIDVLADYVAESLGRRRELITEHVFHRAIEGLLDEEEYRKAARTVKEYNEWLTEFQDLQELNERLETIEETQQRAKYR
ncbi:hypothetical protein SAMN04488063_0009 [Halopelagius inordinatus]|uniref:HTH domain-containing protein n=1 Tax=Halopelagius inordinatus TaxID=553467 RepID=A0A1I2WV16_9EURY|nr:hypothetical protein [Halopelagius inordinatus]SFH05082.1 hypothetical protein SAMN04488063_0009 [Halopelagius inordinatus]